MLPISFVVDVRAVHPIWTGGGTCSHPLNLRTKLRKRNPNYVGL